MHYFDTGMKIIYEQGVARGTVKLRMLSGTSFSTQHVSASGIKWENQSWKTGCNQALGLLSHTTGREPLAVFQGSTALSGKLRGFSFTLPETVPPNHRVNLSFAAL